jgi:hypothetical protein
MQNVPKIVQARLQRASRASVEIHPDADLLTAFAEQSLGESERERVIEHLARCGDCRDVVALALPASEVVTVSFPAARSAWSTPAWLSWPALRWGVVAAGLVLVTSVGLLQYKQRSSQNVAVVTMPARPQEKINASQSAPAPDQAPAAQVISRRDQEIAKVPVRKDARAQGEKTADQPSASLNALFAAPQSTNGPKSAPAGIGSGTGSGIGGGVSRPLGFGSGSGKASTQNPNERLPGAPAGQVLVPGSSSAVEVQAESAQIAAQDHADTHAEEQLAQNRTGLPSQKQPLNNLDVVKAKDSVAPQAESSVGPAAAIPNLSLQNGLRAFPRWAITSSGALQRSFDAGRTWEDVNPSQTALASGAQTESRAELNPEYRDKKARKKEQLNSAAVFRAVAALGPEVWAGGSSAMLYHSFDSGSHWIRVVPLEANASLTGDIVSVDFSNPQHGQIATSSGELWMTSDSGQTWHKQQ